MLLSSSLLFEYSIEYRVLGYSNITATNVTLKETDRQLADYFHVRLHFRLFCTLARTCTDWHLFGVVAAA